MAVSEITEEHYAAPAPAIDGETVRQAGRFLAVGAVGYAVNLAAYAGALHGLALDYRASAVLAFTLALLTTFVLNRRYTFAAADGAIPEQLWRYAIVNLAGFVTNLLVLQGCVELLGAAKLPAEALAAAAAAPVNFLGGRAWAFARRA